MPGRGCRERPAPRRGSGNLTTYPASSSGGGDLAEHHPCRLHDRRADQPSQRRCGELDEPIGATSGSTRPRSRSASRALAKAARERGVSTRVSTSGRQSSISSRSPLSTAARSRSTSGVSSRGSGSASRCRGRAARASGGGPRRPCRFHSRAALVADSSSRNASGDWSSEGPTTLGRRRTASSLARR